jgi:hypothetical protein
MKKATIRLLFRDKLKYENQIGILKEERTKMITKASSIDHRYEYRRNPGHRRPSTGCLGRCIRSMRTIFVNVRKHRNYYDARNTMIHELVHYRFPHMGHGPAFEKRIEEIRKGRTFPPQHMHLFSGYPKHWIDGIDLDPIG